MSEGISNSMTKLTSNCSSKSNKAEVENMDPNSKLKPKIDTEEEEMDCDDDNLDDEEEAMEINESLASALKNTTTNSMQWGSIEVTPILSNSPSKKGKDDILDLTHKNESKKEPDSPDIIVLSDDDIPLVNGKVNGFSPSHKIKKILSEEEKVVKGKVVVKRKEELRNEEMKLILLKKLRQSQQTHQVAPSPPVKESYSHNKSSIIRTNSQVNNSTPPPLVRGNQPHMHSKSIMHQTSHSRNIHRVQSQTGSGGNPPPLMMGPRSGPNHLSNSIQRTISRVSPNVSLTYTSAGGQSHSQNAHHNDRNTENQQTPAQRQAAAKLALRKQLEKTLLQIPPPKPPPPEMHFIPNASNQEFVCLVGLETIVNLIIDDPSLKRPPPTAFVCVQCGTDFTPVWKWDNTIKNGKSGGVICENCLTSNQKKAAKAEHTNRLKTAFVKALQQEQEIEQRMSQTSSPTQHSQTPSNKTRDSGERHRPSPQNAHQSLLQAHQQLQHISRLPPGGSQGAPPTAHMLPFNPLLTPQLYSGAYQVPHSKSSDLQRQYLLDMIPTPRSMPSIPQANLNWKM